MLVDDNRNTEDGTVLSVFDKVAGGGPEEAFRRVLKLAETDIRRIGDKQASIAAEARMEAEN
ncbi:hypothetical protein D3C80_2228360 [compost metagenome]